MSTRVTEAQHVALQEEAWSTGKTVCDWARECIAQQLEKGSPKNLEVHLFTELVGVQLLLMNALEPLLLGEKLPRERVLAIFREVQNTKPGRARELLARRTREREE